MKWLCLLLLYIPFIGLAQTDLCEAVVHWRHTEKVDIYSMPNGEIFQSVKNDPQNDDYISLVILAENKDFFYVDLFFGKYHKNYKGWVKKEVYIGAYSKNEQKIQNLTLYEERDIKAALKIELYDWEAGLITINKCKGKWKLVSLDHNGKRVTGWIESHMLDCIE